MSIDTKDKKILEVIKRKIKTMDQVVRLEKEISSLDKKLVSKRQKMSDLLKSLEDRRDPNKKRPIRDREPKQQPEDSKVLFSEL